MAFFQRYRIGLSVWLPVTGALLAFGVAGGGCSPVQPPVAESHCSSSFRPEEYGKLTVLVQDSTGRRHTTPGVVRQIEQTFNNCLMGKGYDVVTRSDRGTLEKEIELQHSDLNDSDAAEVGRQKNVAAVLIVDVTSADVHSERVNGTTTQQEAYTRHFRSGKSKTDYRPVTRNTSWVEHTARGGIAARLIDVRTGSLLWSSSYEGTDDSTNASAVLVGAARAVGNAFPHRLSATAAPSAATGTGNAVPPGPHVLAPARGS